MFSTIEQQKILCSVVMPVHNGEKFLREAIESVLNQTYTNFEFLIIENCSSDSSVEIIKSYADPRIRLIFEDDCGQVQAYNRGFREAKGELIFIHDQDDFSHPERFEKQLKCIIEKKVDICGSFIRLINKKGALISNQEKKINHEELEREVFYKTTAIHNSSLCIAKWVFTSVGYWSNKYYPVADCEFFIRASLKGIRFGNLPKYLYNYRRHSAQITADRGKKGLVKFRKYTLDHFHKKYQEYNKFYSFKGLLYYYTNNLPLAFFYFVLAILYREEVAECKKKILLIFFFGMPLSIIRRTKFIESEFFVKTKFYIKKFLKL